MELNIEQRSSAWFEARRGIPTASCYKKIITSTGKPAASAGTYMNELLAEWLGASEEPFENEWMARGTELEPNARALYELTTDLEVEEVGFVTGLDGNTGGSPDGLTKKGGLEIKCPKASTHIKYLLSGKCPADYYPQVQGCMWLCEKDKWDFLSYHPELPPFLITVERDDEFIHALELELDKFVGRMLGKREQLTKITEI